MPKDAAEPAWGEMIAEFIHHLEDEECSPNTIHAYRADIEQFARWYRDARELEPDLGELGKRDLLEWLAALEAGGGRGGGRGSVATRNRKRAALGTFFGWARSEGRGVRFEMPKPARRQSRPEPRWLEKAEERALLAAVERAGVRRDYALMQLGLQAGLRASEMAALDWSDVRPGERKGKLWVRRGKGRKERELPINATLRRALLDYGNGKVPRGGPVFAGRDEDGRMSLRHVKRIPVGYAKVARVGRTVGIKRFSHHCLRHTFARRLIEAGVKLPEVARLMGHEDVNTTMVYLQSKEDDLAAAVAALDADDD